MRKSVGVLRVRYQLACATLEDARAKAQDIAYEQTVELPPAAVPPDVRVVGVVESLTPDGAGRWRAEIAFDPAVVGGDLSQLLNVLYGNISLKPGIRVEHVDVPPPMLAVFRGPVHGIAGVRSFCGVEGRALLCTALKPMGLSAERLADLAYRFALGGIDIIKDDHGVTDQASAPFTERVARCQAAVERANRETGRRSMYVPNVTAGPAELGRRWDIARSEGCRGVLLSPMLTGLDAVRELADRAALAVVTHPTVSGVLFHPERGLAPEVWFGQLLRLAGSDGVVYPNAGGRFVLDEAACAAINERLRAPWDGVRPAFPVAGGGIDAARVPEWLERYGSDTIFLVGSSLYVQGDVRRAAERLAEEVERHG
jgi:ribulose-bisphosphate carboxylase large chain